MLDLVQVCWTLKETVPKRNTVQVERPTSVEAAAKTSKGGRL